MNGIGKDPAFVLTLALGTFAVGGFLAISHLGRTSGPVQMSSGFSSRFAPEQASSAAAPSSSHIENFKRGAGVLKTKAAAVASNFSFSFGGPSAPRHTASASSAGNESWRSASSSRGWYADDEGREWGSSYYKGPKGLAAAGGASSWSASAGGASKTGMSAASSVDGAPAADGIAPGGEEMPGVDTEAVARYARSQSSPGAAGQAASAMYASLPSRGGSSYPSSGASQPSQGGSYSGVPAGNTGSVSAMRGGVSAADLGGAEESQRADAMDILNFRADGARSGGEVKSLDASQAKVVADASGSSAGGSSGTSSSSGSSSGSTAGNSPSASSRGNVPSSATPSAEPKKKTEDKTQAPASPVMFAYAQDSDLFKDVASEKLNGREQQYLRDVPPQLKSADDAADTGLDSLLKPRTLHPAPASSGAEKSAAAETPDPEQLESVNGTRREAIKTEMHLFLRRLEERYGKMSDIQRVSCSSDRDACREHGLRGAYISMATSTGAKLALGLKRESCGDAQLKDRIGSRRSGHARSAAKWRLYTIDFIDGEGRRPGENLEDGGGDR